MRQIRDLHFNNLLRIIGVFVRFAFFVFLALLWNLLTLVLRVYSSCFLVIMDSLLLELLNNHEY